MIQSSSKISIDDPVLASFTESIIRTLGSQLRELRLFGSRARGDADTDSDYDILVVADGDSAEIHRVVTDLSYEVLCAYDALMGVLEYCPAEWEKTKRTNLGRNILSDGVILYGA